MALIRKSVGGSGGTGSTGPAGSPGTSFRTGHGVPSGSLGINGDSYLDLDTDNLYGPKTAGAWGASVGTIHGVVGATGAQGPQGTTGTAGVPGTPGQDGHSLLSGHGVPANGTGTNGDSYLNLDTGDLYGPKAGGAWGSIQGNLHGAVGAAGTVGALTSITRIDGCSHSGMIGGYTGGPENSYFKRFAKMLGAKKCGWLSAGGSVACWPTANAGTDGGYSWILNMFHPPAAGDGAGGYMPNTNVAVVHHGAEDLFALGSQNLRPFQEALKTEISRYCSSAVFEDNDPSWAYTGTWSTIAPAGSWVVSAGSEHYSQSVGAAATWTTPADYPGGLVCAIGLGAVPGAVGGGGSLTLGVKVDGVDQPDVVINLDKGGHADSENSKTNGIVLRFGRSDCGLHIPLGSGQHTIQLTYKATTGGSAFFIIDYAQIEADPLDGPIILLPSGFWRVPSYVGKFTVASGWKHGSDAAVDPLNDAAVLALIQAQKDVMTDFPGRCVYVDIDAAFNKDPQFLWTDGIHPSNRGHAVIARTCFDALQASGLLTPRVCSRVGQRSLGSFDGGVWRTIGGVYGTGSNQRPFMNGWVAQSTTSNYPAHMVGRLDDRQHLRGIVKQGGAGAAGSPMWQSDVGEEAPPGYFFDLPCVTYTGTAFAVGYFRQDNALGATPRQAFMAGGGVTAAGSFIELNGLNWMAEGA